MSAVECNVIGQLCGKCCLFIGSTLHLMYPVQIFSEITPNIRQEIQKLLSDG